MDLQGTVTAKDLLTQATLVAEKRVVADILGSFNHCNKNKNQMKDLLSWCTFHGKIIYCFRVQLVLLQCNEIHFEGCLVSSYLL